MSSLYKMLPRICVYSLYTAVSFIHHPSDTATSQQCVSHHKPHLAYANSYYTEITEFSTSTRTTTFISSNYHICILELPHLYLRTTTFISSNYHIYIFELPHLYLRTTTFISSNYHIYILELPHLYPRTTTFISSQNLTN